MFQSVSIFNIYSVENVIFYKYFRDNNYLATGTGDGEIYIWDIINNTLHKKFSLHSSSVKAISFSPEGQKLVSCGSDKVFQIIDISTGMALYNKTLQSVLLCVKWQDFILLLGAEDGTLYVWDIVEVKLLYQLKAHKGIIRQYFP